jgi:two-component system sensor histidine kinase KdpD
MQRLRFTLRYLLAFLLVSLTTLILYSLRQGLSSPVIALLYLLPVVLSATMLGRWEAVTAALSAFFGFNYFFIQPLYTFTVHQPQDLLALIVFLIVAIVISQSISQARSGLEAANARERELTHLYDLTTSLMSLRDLPTIQRTIAAKTLETFQAEWVEVELHPRPADGPETLRLPAASPPRAPDHREILLAASDRRGEIRVWRAGPLTRSEERLLRTFASQGTLALERAHLVLTETRTKVLEESDKLKSALLSSVSHELRTPLATIKAAATSLQSESVDWNLDARRDLLAAIDEETDHLNRLVGNLLDMSRIEAGALHPQRRWNALDEIVAGVLTRLRPRARQHRIELDLPDDLPLLPLDYGLMEQVFTNLISNGLKYAPPDTIIWISARIQDDELVRVQVRNQGPHVPPEHIERIFDKFYRVTAAERVTGTGLGLSICKGIVEAHGGHIWAENLPDGFAFSFTLPRTWEGLAPTQPPEEVEGA